jgi:hypothetical protein
MSTIAKRHRHTAQDNPEARPLGFNRCVSPRDCSPGAHGNVVWAETCACGAQREVAVNGRHMETGAWTHVAAATTWRTDARTEDGHDGVALVASC